MRPLDSIKCDAKMVLMSVDFPSPVCPMRSIEQRHSFTMIKLRRRTDADDIELESSLQELPLDLRRDAVETHVATREDGLRRSLRCGGSGHGLMIEDDVYPLLTGRWSGSRACDIVPVAASVEERGLLTLVRLWASRRPKDGPISGATKCGGSENFCSAIEINHGSSTTTTRFPEIDPFPVIVFIFESAAPLRLSNAIPSASCILSIGDPLRTSARHIHRAREYLGVDSSSGPEEEDDAFKEAPSTDGGESIARRHVIE